MGRDRTLRERLEQLLPDPTDSTVGYVVTVTSYVDPRGITQWTYTLGPGSGGSQAAIQWQDEGTNLGTAGTVAVVNFTGAGVTASRASNTVTVNIPGGGGSSPLTTKGDVWGFSTVDSRIPIGGNGTVLTADSTQALGLRWATPASYTPPVTTKGDLFGFTTVPARIAVGTNKQFLIADSTQAAGVKYTDLSGGLSFRLGRPDGAVLTAGFQRIFVLPASYDSLATWELSVFPAATCSVDIQYHIFGGTRPSSADSIVGGAYPATAASLTATGTTASWTNTAPANGAYIAIAVHANDLASEIMFQVSGRRIP